MKPAVPDIKARLTEDRNQFKAPVLAKHILDSTTEKELLTLCLDKDHVLSSRAMWVLGHCADIDPDRIKPFHAKLIDNLKNKGLHKGVIRTTLRLFQDQAVPVKHEAFMLDLCFNFIKDSSEAIAVRVFSISVAFNIAKAYPELLHELSMIITHLSVTEESPAIKNRMKNTLKAMHKIKL